MSDVTICDFCKKDVPISDLYTDSQLDTKGHKHCIIKLRMLKCNIKGYLGFVKNTSFAGKSRGDLNEMFYKAGQNSIMDIVEPSMLQEKSTKLTYDDHEYRVTVYKSDSFFRLIVIERHMDDYMWSVYSDKECNKFIDGSGPNYDYDNPDYALVDAKEFIIKEQKYNSESSNRG